jgi:large subunit ribosomal protein L19
MSTRLRIAETPFFRKNPLDFQVGDTVEVSVRIPEGDKERIQVFSGRVIRRRGEGLAATFTVRRIVMGEGVERIFPDHSPRVAAVKVASRGAVRRSKLYYLRQRVGKATRLRAVLGEIAADAAAGGDAKSLAPALAAKAEKKADAAPAAK